MTMTLTRISLTSATTRLARVALAVTVTLGLLSGTATAQNDGNVSLGAGVDFVNEYYFRGIIQENQGFIAQPFLEGGFTFGNASITAGTWSSLHSDHGIPDGGSSPQIWYESDFYAGVGFGADMWEAGATYTAYTSPNGSFGTVHELAFSLGISDPVGLSPSVTVAIELDGQADGGTNEGTYLELGVEPAIPLPDDAPIGLSVPVAVGLSLSDYYEVNGESDSYGFFSVGIMASIPLSGVPAEYGSWEIAGGVQFLMFGDALEAINGDDFRPIGVFGLSLGY
jgi:hypothetical protein